MAAAHAACEHEHGHHGHSRIHSRSNGHNHAHAHGHNHDHDRAHNHAHDCGHGHGGGDGGDHSDCSHGEGVWAYLPHGHGLHSRIAADRRSLQLACAILFVSLFVQLMSGLLVNSSVLEAEAVHTLLDGLVIILSLLSIALAGRRGSARYSFGFARAEVLSALVSVLALALMCGHLFIGALRRLPGAIKAAGGAAGAAKGRTVMVAEALTLVNNVLIAWVLARRSSSLNIRALRAHVVGDSIGNVVVLVAGAVMWAYPRMAVLDPVLTIVVVVGIVALNVGLARETLEVLMQAAPQGLDVRVVEKKVRGLAGVAEVRDCHVWTLTSGVVVASVKVFMDDAVRDRAEFQTLQDETAQIFRSAGVDNVTVQVRYSPVPTESEDGGVVIDPGELPTSSSLRGTAPYVLVGTEEV